MKAFGCKICKEKEKVLVSEVNEFEMKDEEFAKRIKLDDDNGVSIIATLEKNLLIASCNKRNLDFYLKGVTEACQIIWGWDKYFEIPGEIDENPSNLPS